MINRQHRFRFLSTSLLGLMLLWLQGGPTMSTTELPHPSSLLPDRIQGYVPQERDGIYTSETLFDLIDGGAEVYRSLNVQRVVSRRYGKPGAPDIIADIFDMGSPEDAFGAFHHDLREGDSVGIGHESELIGGALYFWKDRFYVSIVAFDESSETERVVRGLAEAIAGKIPRSGTIPELVHLLPRQGLEPSQISYFHDWTYLNTRHFLADENLLRLDRTTEGILARFHFEEGSAGGGQRESFLILLIRYPTQELATGALASFRDRFMGSGESLEAYRREDGRWTAGRQFEEVVLLILDATTKPDLEEWMSELKENLGR